MTDLTIRDVNTDADALRVCDFLTAHMLPELGRAKPRFDKATFTVFETAANGAVWIVEEAGEIVGSLGLTQTEFWYSDEEFLTEVWMFVRADRRDGQAFRMMLEEAKAMADLTGLHLMLLAFNPKQTRPKGSMEIIASNLRYDPAGRWIGYAPAGDAAS